MRCSYFNHRGHRGTQRKSYSVASVVKPLSGRHFLWPMEHLQLSGFFLRTPLAPVVICRTYECPTQRMGLEWLRFELRMKLAADEMGMVGQFDHFDVRAVRRRF